MQKKAYTRGRKVTVAHSPHFGRDAFRKIAIVGNNQNASFEGLETVDERGKGFTVEVVGRFIKNDDVGATPCEKLVSQ